MRLCCRSLLRLPFLATALLTVHQATLQAQAARDIPRSLPAETHLPTPANQALPSLFLVGDSEISSGPGGTSASGQGWGEPLAAFFDPTKINVVNRAVTSSSSRAYVTEGFWADTLALVKPDDIVVIQFGPNESGSPGAADTQASLPAETSLFGINDEFREITNPTTQQREFVHTYGWYLRQLVVDTIAHGATPVLCSPLPQRDWQAGHVRQSAGTYAGWAKAIAIQQRVLFIDLNAIVAGQYDALGQPAVAPFFTEAGMITTAAGADRNAQIIVGALKGLSIDPLRGFFSARGEAIPPILPPPPPPPPAPSQQPHL